MQRGFTKLFNTIVTSTIWQEDDQTRILWITMLAVADAYGIVSAALPGLASIAKVPLEAAQKAIQILESPDQWSRTKEFDGRRIESIEGGWRILNYQKYRQMLNDLERREYKAKWMRDHRKARGQNVDKGGQKWTKVTQAEAEAEEEDKKPLRSFLSSSPQQRSTPSNPQPNPQPTSTDQERANILRINKKESEALKAKLRSS